MKSNRRRSFCSGLGRFRKDHGLVPVPTKVANAPGKGVRRWDAGEGVGKRELEGDVCDKR